MEKLLRLGIPQTPRDSHFPTAATTTKLRLHFKCLDNPSYGYILKWLDRPASRHPVMLGELLMSAQDYGEFCESSLQRRWVYALLFLNARFLLALPKIRVSSESAPGPRVAKAKQATQSDKGNSYSLTAMMP